MTFIIFYVFLVNHDVSAWLFGQNIFSLREFYLGIKNGFPEHSGSIPRPLSHCC